MEEHAVQQECVNVLQEGLATIVNKVFHCMIYFDKDVNHWDTDHCCDRCAITRYEMIMQFW